MMTDNLFKALWKNAPVALALYDGNGVLIEANDSFCALFGMRDSCGTTALPLLDNIHKQLLKECGTVHYETVVDFDPVRMVDPLFFLKRGVINIDVTVKKINYHDQKNTTDYYIFAVSDITERIKVDRFTTLSTEIFGILNDEENITDVIRRILGTIKKMTGCDAAGIRLCNNNDYPYFVQDGFDENFLSTENSLITPNYGTCRNPDGSVPLECLCGMVISGKTDPHNPLFTAGGSFWTNESTELLHLKKEEELPAVMRNRCIYTGYASIALIPLRVKNKIVGLLQLNNKKKNSFALETIHFFESIGASIGIALIRKQDEESVRQATYHLERQTAIATQMASEAALANAAKTDFLAMMSHEIRTPLNGVIGIAHLLLDMNLTSDQRHYAEIIWTSGKFLLDIINDVLDFSKIEAGKLELDSIDFNLIGLLDEFSGMFGIRAQEKELDFACVIAPDVPSFVRGDPNRLRQILANLVGNAIKFTNNGEIVIRVTLQSMSEYNFILHFSVQDSGIGIAVEKTETLFQRFAQIDRSTSRTYGGTGLGLAISKELCELMGGAIGVTSVQGQGSQFWFTVKLEKALQSSYPALFPARAVPSQLHLKRILIIDDHAASREALAMPLRASGLRVDEALDGVDGLRQIYASVKSQDQVTMAIIDMTMNGMDGGAVANAIRSDSRTKNILIVLLAPINKKTTSPPFEDTTGVEFLTKPVRQLEFFNSVISLLSGKPIDASLQNSREKPGAGTTTVAQYSRILLVEDSVINQKVAVGMLQKFGFSCDVAENGSDALKAMKTSSYDLVLMDIQMPVMDGFETTKRIREEGELLRKNNVPIIAMTGNAIQGDREKCLTAGMSDYITKPVDPEKLFQILYKWLPACQLTQNDVSDTLDTKCSKLIQLQESKQIPVFDVGALRKRLMNDESLFQKIVHQCFEEIPLLQCSLQKAFLQKDLQKIAAIAHTIKGAAATAGADALQTVAHSLQQTASDALDCTVIAEAVCHTDGEINRFLEVLEEYR
ncbi:MAG: response regulator [Chitinivibrionales bacterium]|nr:response regulator [Chitinivibrionales bacterium]